MFLRLAALLGCVLLANGCATVTGSETQIISVETLEGSGTPVAGADCKLTNDYGYWNLRSPGIVTVRKSAEDLLVHCQLERQAPGTTRAMSTANAGMFGNVLLGGLVGAVIDHSSGKAYDYPRMIHVVLGAHRVVRDDDVRMPSAPPPPAASRSATLAPVPEIRGTFAPAHPALPSIGSTWQYSLADQRFGAAQQLFTIRVTSVDGWDVRESLDPGTGTASSVAVNARELDLLARRVQGEQTILEMGPYFYATELAKTIEAPRRPRDYPLGIGGWHIEAPRLSDDETSVPAGKFKTRRIDIAGSNPSSPVGHPVRFQYSAWYAPEVKRYVMLRHQAWNRQGGLVGDEVVKLVEYRAD